MELFNKKRGEKSRETVPLRIRILKKRFVHVIGCRNYCAGEGINSKLDSTWFFFSGLYHVCSVPAVINVDFLFAQYKQSQ
jgi:hypothetical protein